MQLLGKHEHSEESLAGWRELAEAERHKRERSAQAAT